MTPPPASPRWPAGSSKPWPAARKERAPSLLLRQSTEVRDQRAAEVEGDRQLGRAATVRRQRTIRDGSDALELDERGSDCLRA
jgi:hypothetical protein